MSEVQLVDITKRYGATLAVDRLSLEIQRGEFFAFLGPSGCGKTTTLRMIAGLVTPTAGEICIQDRPITYVPPYKRNIGMVFQDYALFPHMTVFDNVAFGLAMKHWNKSRSKARVKELLDLIGLPEIANRYPSEISGGQKQRVALARALAPEPEVLLLEEPLSNLDLKLRQNLRLELRRIQRELKITTIFVTHDQGEALSLSDRIMLMKDGRMIQQGTPAEIYMHPRTTWAASFLGDANLFRGTLAAANAHGTLFTTDRGLLFPLGPDFASRDQAGTTDRLLAIRPEAVRLFPADAPLDREKYTAQPGQVENFAYVGSGTRYVLRLKASGDSILVDATDPGAPWPEGTVMQVGFPREGWILLQD
jgi:putative spermidine/putrescine transport system ATP-binding protein